MTDRELCRKCIHSCFSSYTRFQYCNYLDDTGNRRPHDGDVCYGFEAWDGKKKRRRQRTNGSTLNENNVQKAAEAVQMAEDKMLRKTAARIRNKMFDEMAMWTQHMGDDFNRIV